MSVCRSDRSSQSVSLSSVSFGVQIEMLFSDTATKLQFSTTMKPLFSDIYSNKILDMFLSCVPASSKFCDFWFSMWVGKEIWPPRGGGGLALLGTLNKVPQEDFLLHSRPPFRVGYFPRNGWSNYFPERHTLQKWPSIGSCMGSWIAGHSMPRVSPPSPLAPLPGSADHPPTPSVLPAGRGLDAVRAYGVHGEQHGVPPGCTDPAGASVGVPHWSPPGPRPAHPSGRVRNDTAECSRLIRNTNKSVGKSESVSHTTKTEKTSGKKRIRFPRCDMNKGRSKER